MFLPREVDIFQSTGYTEINGLWPTEKERFLCQPSHVSKQTLAKWETSNPQLVLWFPKQESVSISIFVAFRF